MDLTLSDDQRSIVASISDFLADAMPSSRLRTMSPGEGGDLDEFWKSVADLGWFGLGLGESHGGAGYDLADEMLLFKQIGRRLVPGPLLATVLGARVASHAAQPELAGQILRGEVRVGLATAPPADGGLLGPGVSGSFVLVDAAEAVYLLIADRDGAVLVPATACVDRRPAPGLDELTVREAASLVVADGIYLPATADPVYLRGAVLTSAILVGIAEATRDMSTEHAKTRVQFGSPIGVFQAIKHRCADMAAGAAIADAQLMFAALSVAEGRPDVGFQVAAARVVAARSALSNARENIQIHGGMGFTWESDAHFYLKRAHAVVDLFGSRRQHEGVLLHASAAY